MELCKNIFFNTDKLTENTDVKISYTGKFFQDDSQEVYIHLGFGKDWDNLEDIKMEKTDLGYQATISLIESNSISFCFKNDKDEWDNNDGQNYLFPIEKVEKEDTEAFVPIEQSLALTSPRKLRKSYIITKKIKLAIYRLLKYIPKLVSGNYTTKKSNDEE